MKIKRTILIKKVYGLKLTDIDVVKNKNVDICLLKMKWAVCIGFLFIYLRKKNVKFLSMENLIISCNILQCLRNCRDLILNKKYKQLSLDLGYGENIKNIMQLM